MSHLRIELTKRSDGGTVLRCVRPDGSATWQRSEGRQAAFFPLHDLTHYAVETGLGFTRGFFGLIADGWEIDDTTGNGSRGPLPAEAVLVEHLVGFLDVERATRGIWTAEEYAAQLTLAGVDAAALPRPLTDDALRAVRQLRDELLDRWAAVDAGARLELAFTSGEGPGTRARRTST